MRFAALNIAVAVLLLAGCHPPETSVPVVAPTDLDAPPHLLTHIRTALPLSPGSKVEPLAAVSFIIEPDGTVSAVKLIRATSEAAGRAAVESVKHWRFDPPRRHGNPVRVRMTVPIDWTLDKGD